MNSLSFRQFYRVRVGSKVGRKLWRSNSASASESYVVSPMGSAMPGKVIIGRF